MNALTVLICTHNRADLLERTLASLNAAARPTIPVQILVAANACTDRTLVSLRDYQAQQTSRGWLPLDFIEEPTPGKSHALNTAIPLLTNALTALVDDDHRVDRDYLNGIVQAAEMWPDAGLYCGRIVPDWDGNEPSWVHDEGPYRIYPLPVPRYEQGTSPKVISIETGPIPGGGNLVVRRRVFEQTGRFSTELGPHGHDLGGGEDSEYVRRALERGEICRYVPSIVQYHYVDHERLRLSYLLKKSYQRTRSTARLDGDGSVPLYMWRKLTEYGFHGVVSSSWEKRRFYWIRFASALGELRGQRESGHRRKQLDLWIGRSQCIVGFLAFVTLVSAVTAVLTTELSWLVLLPVLILAGVGTAAILGKSLLDFSLTGPDIRKEVLRHYRRYTFFALTRLSAWAYTILVFIGSAGMLIGYLYSTARGQGWNALWAINFAILGMIGGIAWQFIRKLRFNPGLLVASMHYRTSRIYCLWRWMTPERIVTVEALLIAATLLLFSAAAWRLTIEGRVHELLPLTAALLFVAGVLVLARWEPEAQPVRSQRPPGGTSPNILLIGSDTLRADRLGAAGYRRALTPHIDALAEAGALFTNCYVPCARTAPSLISLLTGTWPHHHGIRDNFSPLREARLKVDALPTLLKPHGYRSAVVSDWCGADLGKFSFGFDHTDLPADQWNLKYLIRQGPKDLRLFVSLFTHNRLGRWLLPELYYLGGAPLTQPIGRRARRLLSRLAESEAPFFLNVFYSTTHPPFASEWPWYTLYADPAYKGESKFAMARLTDPLEIIRRQGAPREEFDLDHILDLYDGCVAHFDDEVGKLLAHLDACGLSENTIVVVYSDHGMEFFEQGAWGQGNSAVGEASPRIPLIIRDPRRAPRGRIDDVVRSIDLAPTLLELTANVRPSGMDGVSLAACVNGAPCPALDAFNETGIWFADIPGLPANHLRYPNLLELLEVPDREVGSLGVKPEYSKQILTAKDRMIRRGRWKLVYQPLLDGARIQLFDLIADPECRQDLSGSHPDVRCELEQALLAWVHEVPAPLSNIV